MRPCRVKAGFLALAAVAGLAGFAAPTAGQASGQTVRERSYAFDRDGAFRVMVMEGRVRARAWDRDSIRVVARLDAEARGGFYLGVSSDGSGGKMGVEGSGVAEIEITLPRGASLWVKTSGGAIDVAGVEGSVDVFSVTGDIGVEGSPGSLHAEAMGGGVTLAGEPRVARVRTGAGDLEVRGGGQDLTLSTVSGAIALTTAAPLRRALVETVSGRVAIATSLEPGSTLTVNSHDGAVELELPARTDADFVVGTLEGELRNLLTEGGARKSSGLRGRELSFSAGRGGAAVTVRTFSGDVTVRPAGGGG